MKIAFVFCHPLMYAPYISLYQKVAQEQGCETVIINEHERAGELAKNHIVYKGNYGGNIVNKLRNFLAWRRFVINTLKEQKADKIVFLTPWAPIKLVDKCMTSWKGKYVLDIRDFSSEGASWFRKAEEQVIRNSVFTTVSSKGFFRWLPKSGKYAVAHNMPANIVEDEVCRVFEQDRIRIAYVGLVGYFEQNKSIVEQTKGTRFDVVYSGTLNESCPLEAYCQEHGHGHVTFTGPFNNAQKRQLYDGVDFINAVYGNDSEVVRSALPNKLYDAMIYKIPLLASKGTYLAQIAEEWGIGIGVDTQANDLVEQLERYMANFDREKFVSQCKKLLKVCIEEQAVTHAKIKEFFLNESNTSKIS